jgi:hypothetical protein
VASFVLLTLLAASLHTRAAAVSWAGGGDGSSWNDPLNWSGNTGLAEAGLAPTDGGERLFLRVREP